MRFRESEEKMEFWDIYDSEKKKTGRTMKRNDWCLKDGGVSSDGIRCDYASGSQISDYQKGHDESLGTRLVGSIRRGCYGGRDIRGGCQKRDSGGNRT